MRVPEQLVPDDILYDTPRDECGLVRPIGLHGLCLWRRVKLAAKVFFGMADAFVWDRMQTISQAEYKQAEAGEEKCDVA